MIRVNVVFMYLVITALSVTVTNSRTSTLWRLNNNGRITTGSDVSQDESADTKADRVKYQESVGNNYAATSIGSIGAASAAASASAYTPLSFETSVNAYVQDEAFYIIASTLNDRGNVANGAWIRQSPEDSLETFYHQSSNNSIVNIRNDSEPNNSGVDSSISTSKKRVPTTATYDDEILDCGKPVNFTYYDYLIGVGQRFNNQHRLVPEPEVAYLFLKNKDENSYKNFDIGALERRLKKAKREKPRSVQLYNQIGNYWRIVGGDARLAIECFRRALAMSPTNAEVLLNLARVLYNLQYLDDAIHLTRRSLEMQPPGRSAWQQYFTLGEIFKAYGHFQESILHLRHALELYPHHEPILKALRDLEPSSSTLHVYTIVIIVGLVIAVFVVILKSSVGGDGSSKSHSNGAPYNNGSSSGSGGCLGGNTSSMSPFEFEMRTQRHFNRAMQMRCLKGLSAKNLKHRKY